MSPGEIAAAVDGRAVLGELEVLYAATKWTSVQRGRDRLPRFPSTSAPRRFRPMSLT
jgi:hypothetical protein